MSHRLRASAPIFFLWVSTLLVACRQPVSINVATAPPENVPLTFDQADDVVVVRGSLLQVSIGESFDSYQWILDGTILPGQTSALATVDSTSLPLGVHHLSVIVDRDDRRYSKTLRFQVSD